MVHLGSIWVLFWVGVGSVWGRFRVGLGSIWGCLGIDSELAWGRSEVDFGGIKNIPLSGHTGSKYENQDACPTFEMHFEKSFVHAILGHTFVDIIFDYHRRVFFIFFPSMLQHWFLYDF